LTPIFIKILKREVGEEKALLAAGYMKNSPVIPLDETLICFEFCSYTSGF
jgi:hypothetical protein